MASDVATPDMFQFWLAREIAALRPSGIARSFVAEALGVSVNTLIRLERGEGRAIDNEKLVASYLRLLGHADRDARSVYLRAVGEWLMHGEPPVVDEPETIDRWASLVQFREVERVVDEVEGQRLSPPDEPSS